MVVLAPRVDDGPSGGASALAAPPYGALWARGRYNCVGPTQRAGCPRGML